MGELRSWQTPPAPPPPKPRHGCLAVLLPSIGMGFLVLWATFLASVYLDPFHAPNGEAMIGVGLFFIFIAYPSTFVAAIFVTAIWLSNRPCIQFTLGRLFSLVTVVAIMAWLTARVL